MVWLSQLHPYMYVSVYLRNPSGRQVSLIGTIGVLTIVALVVSAAMQN